MADNLFDKINELLAKRGLPPVKTGPMSDGSLTLEDHSDGKGPVIAHWAPELGPRPTVEDGFSADELVRHPSPIKEMKIQNNGLRKG